MEKINSRIRIAVGKTVITQITYGFVFARDYKLTANSFITIFFSFYWMKHKM